MVQDAITSRNIEAHSPRADLLDDIALKLDDQSPVLANWSSLAAKLGVPRKTFKLFERRSVQSPTHNMFEYLAATRPHLTLTALKDAFELMNRNDLLQILRNQDLRGKCNCIWLVEVSQWPFFLPFPKVFSWLFPLIPMEGV